MKKFPKKLIILSVLLFLIIPIFSACSQVGAMMLINSDGTVEEIVQVKLNQTKIEQAGYSYLELVNDVEQVANNQIDAMINRLNKKVDLDLLVLEDMESKETLTVYKNGIEKTVKKDGDKIFISAKFKTVDVYKYYYNIKSSNQVERKIEKHFFYDKVYYHSNTSFLKHYELFNALKDYFSVKYPQIADMSENELLYTYKTDSRREHSDADYIKRDGLDYYHTWVVDADEVDRPIMFYYNIANSEVFILLGIVVAFVCGGVMTIIAFALKKKDRK